LAQSTAGKSLCGLSLHHFICERRHSHKTTVIVPGDARRLLGRFY
jgi:hypothetical protein